MEKVEQNIAAGNYKKARDRLQGLLSTYPNRLDLRRRLGDVYWAMDEPLMAGRYWYLEAKKNADMESASAAFVHSCQDDATKILQRLKFRGDLRELTQPYAQERLGTLQEQADQQTHADDTNLKIMLWSLLIIVLILLALAIIGAITVVQWVL